MLKIVNWTIAPDIANQRIGTMLQQIAEHVRALACDRLMERRLFAVWIQRFVDLETRFEQSIEKLCVSLLIR
jgi:hypothetical protein